MSRYRPKGLAKGVGFQRPTASGLRASSPRPDQGGIVETLIQASFISGSSLSCIAPESGFDRRRLAQALAIANPTTPASAGACPAPVPSHASARSADAAASHEPSAPTRPSARRGWSAYADDGGRSEFPLEPPSFAPEGEVRKNASSAAADLAVALQLFRVSQAFSGARRRL
jgi:hypothetical protein